MCLQQPRERLAQRSHHLAVEGRLHEVVKFHWEAVAPDGEVTAVGLVFLALGTDGRIRRDYVFIES